MLNYETLRKKWAEKNFVLPELPEGSAVTKSLVKKLDSLDSLDREAARIRNKLTRVEKQRAIINYELKGGHFDWSGGKAAREKLEAQAENISMRAEAAKQAVLAELRASKENITKEITQLEEDSKAAANKKEEEKKKTNNDTAIIAATKEFEKIDSQLKQMKALREDLEKDGKKDQKPDIFKNVEDFTRDRLSTGNDAESLLKAAEKSDITEWAKGGNKRDLTAGAIKGSSTYKVRNWRGAIETRTLDFEDSKDGTTFSLKRTHMIKKWKSGTKNKEYFGKYERGERIKAVYKKTMQEGYREYTMPDSYKTEEHESVKRWHEKNMVQTAGYVREAPGGKFKPTFEGPIRDMDDLPKEKRTSGFQRRLNYLKTYNDEICIQNLKLADKNLEKLHALEATRNHPSFEQFTAAQDLVFTIRNVADSARNSIALALNKVPNHNRNILASAKALEALTAACDSAQEACALAQSELQRAREEFDRQKGILSADHPDLLTLKENIQEAAEKLDDAYLAYTRARNVIATMTAVLPLAVQEKMRDAIIPHPELMNILAKVVATDDDSLTKLATIIVDAEVLDPAAYAARLPVIKGLIQAADARSVDLINQALRLNPTVAMEVLNTAHFAIKAPEYTDRIIEIFDMIPNASAGLVSLNNGTLGAAVGVLAEVGNEAGARAVVTHDANVTGAAVRVLESDGHQANAARVLNANFIGSDMIASNTTCLLALLKVSQAGRNFIANDDVAVLQVLRASESGRQRLANDPTSCATIAQFNIPHTVGVLVRSSNRDSAANVLLRSVAALGEIANDQESFLALMRADNNSAGRNIVADNDNAFVALMRTSTAGHLVIANDVASFRALMLASLAGRQALVTEVNRVKPNSIFDAVMAEFSPAPSASVRDVGDDAVEMVGNLLANAARMDQEITRIRAEFPTLSIITSLSDEKLKQWLFNVAAARGNAEPATIDAAVQEAEEIVRNKVKQFLETATDAEINTLSQGTRLEATNIAINAPHPIDAADDKVAAVMGTAALDVRERATHTTFNDTAHADDIYNAVAPVHLQATRTALESGEVAVTTLLAVNQTLVKGALTTAISEADGSVIQDTITNLVRLEIVTDILNDNTNATNVVQDVRKLDDPRDHGGVILREVVDHVFTNNETTEANNALLATGIDVAARQGATRAAFGAANATAVIDVLRNTNIAVFKVALTGALTHNHGEAFNVVDNNAPGHTRTTMLTDSLNTTDRHGIKGGAVNTLKTAHPNIYRATLSAVMNLPDPAVQREISNTLALRSSASIAANNAITALAAIVEVDEVARNALADILTDAHMAANPSDDREVIIVGKRGRVLNHSIDAVNEAIASSPIATMAVLDKLYGKTKDSDAHLAALLNNHAESGKIIRDLNVPSVVGVIKAEHIDQARKRDPEKFQKAVNVALAVADPKFIANAIDAHPGVKTAIEAQANRVIIEDAKDKTPVSADTADLAGDMKALKAASVKTSPAVAFAVKRITNALNALYIAATTATPVNEAMLQAMVGGATPLTGDPLLKAAKSAIEKNPITAFKNAKVFDAAAVTVAINNTISGLPGVALIVPDGVIPGNDPLVEIENSASVISIRNTLLASDPAVRVAQNARDVVHQNILARAEKKFIDENPAVRKARGQPFPVSEIVAVNFAYFCSLPEFNGLAAITNANEIKNDHRQAVAKIQRFLGAARVAQVSREAREHPELINFIPEVAEAIKTVDPKLARAEVTQINNLAASSVFKNDVVIARAAIINLAAPEKGIDIILADSVAREALAKRIVNSADGDVVRDQFKVIFPGVDIGNVVDVAAALQPRTIVGHVTGYTDPRTVFTAPVCNAIQNDADVTAAVYVKNKGGERGIIADAVRCLDADEALEQARRNALVAHSEHNTALIEAMTSVCEEVKTNDVVNVVMNYVLNKTGKFLTPITGGVCVTLADGQRVNATADEVREGVKKAAARLNSELARSIEARNEIIQQINKAIKDGNAQGARLNLALKQAEKLVADAQKESEKLGEILESLTDPNALLGKFLVVSTTAEVTALTQAHKAACDVVTENIKNARANAYDELALTPTSVVAQAITGIKDRTPATINTLVATADAPAVMAAMIKNNADVRNALAQSIVGNPAMRTALEASIPRAATREKDIAAVAAALARASEADIASIIDGDRATFATVVRASAPLCKAFSENRALVETMPGVAAEINARPRVRQLTAIEGARTAERNNNLRAILPDITATLIANDAAWNAFRAISPAHAAIPRTAADIQEYILERTRTNKELLAIANKMPTTVKTAIENSISDAKLDTSVRVQAAWKKEIDEDPEVKECATALEKVSKGVGGEVASLLTHQTTLAGQVKTSKEQVVKLPDRIKDRKAYIETHKTLSERMGLSWGSKKT